MSSRTIGPQQQKTSWFSTTISEWNSQFWITVFKGEVPEEDNKKSDKITEAKDAELEQMRKSKRQHRDHFKMMEAGKLPEQKKEHKRRGDTKLLVGKLKDVSTQYLLKSQLLVNIFSEKA